MSEKRLLQDYLNDILESITDIEDFTKGMIFDVFSKDRKTIKAVVRSLEVIGEAGNKIPDNIQKRYSEIPWTEIVGMRNRLIHEYFGVDIDIVWETIKEDLEPFKVVVKKMLSDLYGIQ
ncbi:MAG: DUF86 domain-containing protein [Nitrospirota bacterium]|jgi:uncharacterized protein with HEPN domain